jgi:hypothetical protein
MHCDNCGAKLAEPNMVKVPTPHCVKFVCLECWMRALLREGVKKVVSAFVDDFNVE